MKILNKNQKEYISNQLATLAAILFGSIGITNFFPDNIFNLKIFIISLGVTLGFYITGVIL